MRRTITIAVLVFLASVGASTFAWWSFVSPTAFRRVPESLIYAVNFPAAAVGAAYGRPVEGGFFNAVVRHCHYCSAQEHRASYFAAAIPGYFLLFGATVFCALRWRARRGTAA